MNTRTLTILAAAIAVTAVSFTAPASAISLGTAGQTVTQSLDKPNRIHLFEVWRDKAALEEHASVEERRVCSAFRHLCRCRDACT